MALIANPRVVEIREQQRIDYLLDDAWHHYTCDFVVTWESGLRVAYEVKYARDVVRKGVESFLLAVCAGCDDEVADELRIVTETNLSLVEIENGAFVIACAKDQDRDGLKAVAEWLRHAPGRLTLADIDAGTGLGDRARRAAVALMQTGVLTAPHDEIIHGDLELTNRVAH